ncbi:hypothetical protein LTR84_007498 [Exophiala bonariae]|uniref:Enoyl reductase (ER) domain-containing protein n=1 Tax=Exophiala bonariae TaxID=1690606 RepID=A0AAV9MYN9_9EURO|nr:hypothetical protein LTR84_007498 [Exophiala bonariae]
MPSAWQILPSESKDWRTLDGISNLHLANDVEKPNPGPKTALIRIRAAALNARDMMVVARDPIYQSFASPNLSPCGDGAGEDEYLLAAPSSLSYEELAALPCAAGTAANALFFGPMPLKKGMTVLTQGTGGVSSGAIQLASACGATVIATSSSDSKLELAKKMGASHTINYNTTPNWAEEVLRITNGKGVDHVLDVGGADTLEQSLQATRQAGLVSLIGYLSKPKTYDIVPAMLFGAKTIRGIFQIRKDMVAKVLKIYDEKGLHPQISHTYEWENAKDAFAALVAQSGVGKIVIKVGK